MSQELINQSGNQVATVDEMKNQIQFIQKIIKEILIDGEHYGVIPFTKKPTLLKAGAEKLCNAFRLAPKYAVTQTNENQHREYQIICSLYHIQSGNFAGEGVGLCSTLETKYRYRKQNRVCPACSQETIIKGKAEFGGGWICWAKDENDKQIGCGAKFSEGDPQIENQKVGRIENPDIADTYNTVLKIAKKRALVDAVLNCTAASDIFTQDLYENHELKSNGHSKLKSEPKQNGNGNGNCDPNAIWGEINKKMREEFKGMSSTEENEMRKVILEQAGQAGKSLDDYIGTVSVLNAIQFAFEEMQKEGVKQ